MNFANVSLNLENRVGYLTIDHPPANALSAVTFAGLSDCLDYAESTEEIKVLIITGKGRFFVAGADIKEFDQAFGHAEKGTELALVGQRVFTRIEHFSKPVIAAINGACLGGGLELALSCHMRIVADQAVLGLPELRLGLIPGFAGTQRLARVIPKAKAIELLLTSQTIDGKEAERIGIANYSLPLAEVLPKAKQLAESIAFEKSSISMAAVLKAVNEGLELPLEQGQALEAKLFGKMFCTEDAKEGITAFLEKRTPEFKDK